MQRGCTFCQTNSNIFWSTIHPSGLTRKQKNKKLIVAGKNCPWFCSANFISFLNPIALDLQFKLLSYPGLKLFLGYRVIPASADKPVIIKLSHVFYTHAFFWCCHASSLVILEVPQKSITWQHSAMLVLFWHQHVVYMELLINRFFFLLEVSGSYCLFSVLPGCAAYQALMGQLASCENLSIYLFTWTVLIQWYKYNLLVSRTFRKHQLKCWTNRSTLILPARCLGVQGIAGRWCLPWLGHHLIWLEFPGCSCRP